MHQLWREGKFKAPVSCNLSDIEKFTASIDIFIKYKYV